MPRWSESRVDSAIRSSPRKYSPWVRFHCEDLNDLNQGAPTIRMYTMSANHTHANSETPAQPSLTTLFSKYLQQQTESHALGLAAVDPNGEVMPYDVGPVQPIDARPAWSEALAVATQFDANFKASQLQAPPQWPQLVLVHEPAAALAFSFGNFPQLVRNLHLLMARPKLADLRPRTSTAMASAALQDWATAVARKQQYPQLLLAAGTLRLAKQFEPASQLLRSYEASVPTAWRDAWANELAAVSWHRGRYDEARALWQSQPASVPVLFNRGMAALFCDEPVQAVAPLSAAVAKLPENGAWYHLGQLYLTLAQTRR